MAESKKKKESLSFASEERLSVYLGTDSGAMKLKEPDPLDFDLTLT